MKRRTIVMLLLVACCVAQQSWAAEPAKLVFDTYSGYFVSNKFEPNAAKSFVVITDQEQFDKVFGVAFVMNDKSHRLPKDAFKSLMVVSAIKRGNAVVEYKVESVTEASGVVELRYTTIEKKSDTATFACPLIVSIPKGTYKAIQFQEDGKTVGKVELPGDKPKAEKPKMKDVAVIVGALGFMAGWELLHTEKVKVTVTEGKIAAEPQEIKRAHRIVFEVSNAGKQTHQVGVLKTVRDLDKLDVDGDKVRFDKATVTVQPGKSAKLEQHFEESYDGLYSSGTAFVLFCNEPQHYQNGERSRIVVK